MIYKKVVNWERRCIETYYRGARTVRFFDHMLLHGRDRVAQEIQKITESGYQPQSRNRFEWTYTKGATL